MKITNRILPLLAALILAFTQFSTRAVDYNAVQVDVTMHPDHYRSLLKRFEKGDTTLTSAEVATVYYGYSFTHDYDPSAPYDDLAGAFKEKDYEKVAELAPAELAANPVSLDINLMALTAATHGAGKDAGKRAIRLGARADMVATAILESGRGTSSDSPFQVISTADIDRLLYNVLGINAVVGRTKVGDIDAVKVVFPQSDRQHILYFDNTREAAYLARKGAGR